MLSIICLYWIGLQLNAPIWYNAVLLICLFFSVYRFAKAMYESGKKASK